MYIVHFVCVCVYIIVCVNEAPGTGRHSCGVARMLGSSGRSPTTMRRANAKRVSWGNWRGNILGSWRWYVNGQAHTWHLLSMLQTHTITHTAAACCQSCIDDARCECYATINLGPTTACGLFRGCSGAVPSPGSVKGGMVKSPTPSCRSSVIPLPHITTPPPI